MRDTRNSLKACSLWLALCAAGPASAQQTAKELLQYCTPVERGARAQPAGTVLLPGNYGAHVCWGYLSAMQDMSVLTEDGLTTLTGSCAAPDTTLLQLVHVFDNYARKHPEQLHKKPAEVVLYAFREAFPCKGGGH
jgi:hypothetical protein